MVARSVAVDVAFRGVEMTEVWVAGKNTTVLVGVGLAAVGVAGTSDAAGVGVITGSGVVSPPVMRVGITAPGVRNTLIQTGWVRMEGSSG